MCRQNLIQVDYQLQELIYKLHFNIQLNKEYCIENIPLYNSLIYITQYITQNIDSTEISLHQVHQNLNTLKELIIKCNTDYFKNNK